MPSNHPKMNATLKQLDNSDKVHDYPKGDESDQDDSGKIAGGAIRFLSLSYRSQVNVKPETSESVA